ncbi:MAG: glycosyltransferase family 1 protein [bacterium]|nr:glycosyltransferase family 1 protein [bacterium]
MKFAIDMRSSQEGIGGIPEYTSMIAYHCAQMAPEHEFFLFYSGRNVYVPEWIKETKNVRVSVHTMPNKFTNARLHFFGRPYLDQVLRKETNTIIDAWFFPNLNFIALSPNQRSVITVHDVSFKRYPEFFSKKQRWWHSVVHPDILLLRSQKIIAVSEHTKSDVIREFKTLESKIEVTQLGFDTSFCLTSQSSSTQIQKYGRAIVTYAGGDMRKNLDVIIHGYRLLRSMSSRFDDVSLHIVGRRGRWIGNSIHGVLKDYESNVHLYDGLSRSETISLMRQASVFVYPSFYEGFGLPLLEAMSAGIPVIASPNSAILETAHNAAFFSDPYNPHAMARSLDMLLSNTALRSRLNENAQRRINEYSWRKTASRTLSVLEQAVRTPLHI